MPLDHDEKIKRLKNNYDEFKKRRDRFRQIINEYNLTYEELYFLNLSRRTFKNYCMNGNSIKSITPGKNTMLKLEHYVKNRKP